MNEKNNNQQADDFESAWQEALMHPLVVVWSALINLTSMGEHPVEIERLAAAIGRPPEEAVALAQQWARARVADGLIHFDLESGPFSRYRVEIGTRVMHIGGCAPDLFMAVLVTGMSIRVESICPTTGTTIRVALSPDGVELVEPSGTVIAVLNPRASSFQEADNIEDVDADVCSQQPLFASAEAAASWLASHPGRRIYPVAEFFEWFRRILAVGDANA
jgi:alkylmercury lyase